MLWCAVMSRRSSAISSNIVISIKVCTLHTVILLGRGKEFEWRFITPVSRDITHYTRHAGIIAREIMSMRTNQSEGRINVT